MTEKIMKLIRSPVREDAIMGFILLTREYTSVEIVNFFKARKTSKNSKEFIAFDITNPINDEQLVLCQFKTKDDKYIFVGHGIYISDKPFPERYPIF